MKTQSNTSSIIPSGYAPLLADLKARVRAAQVKAAVTVNRELILLYWHIGREILRAQRVEGWGAKVVERLAKDLTAEFPEMGGFSRANMLFMRSFYAAWAPVEIVQQPLTQLEKAKVQQTAAPIVLQPVRQLDDAPPEPLALLPWSTNLVLLHKLKDPTARLWYARKALEHGWSRAVLTVQIESRLHERSGKAITNFDRTLPPAQSDMAREVLKDPYTFDFLSLSEEAHERDLERGLVEHVQQLLLEMGAGFAFVGRQVRLDVGGEEFSLDLLFYHLRLRCFVVVDLKMKPFEPEFAGKMNFYLSAVDDQMRHADDAPTIGLLLCKDAKNRLKVEYALRDVKKPIGVAQWQTRLVESLPKNLRGSLPTIADLERELSRPRKRNSKPSQMVRLCNEGALKTGPTSREKEMQTRSKLCGHLPGVLVLLFLLLGTGCTLFRTAVDVPGQTVRAVTGQTDQDAVDPVTVQQALLRFSDEFLTQIVIGLEKLERGTNSLSTAEALQWKIAIGMEMISIASGPNAVANLLDMTVFFTVIRVAMEEYWQPKVLGESALPLLESFRNAEAEIWRLAGTVLKPEQQAELHKAIDDWRLRNPVPKEVLSARVSGFVSEITAANPGGRTKPGSVFALLNVDPLSGLDPAMREIAQTRLFAERALYFAQKLPLFLRWQTELLAVNSVEMPAMQRLLTNSTQIASSIERFAAVAEKLPEQLSSEREEILKGLEAQEKALTPLVREIYQSVSAGTQMSTSLNTTLTTFDALMKRFGVGETNRNAQAKTNSQPFRIQDYGETAVRLEAAARELTGLLGVLNQTIGSTNLLQLSAQVGPAVQQAQSSGKELVDYAFRKGVFFVMIVLVSMLAYRFFGSRLGSNGIAAKRSP